MTTGIRPTLLWGALLLGAQVASFGLLRAGKIVGYQHWAFDRLAGPSVAWIGAAVLALQLALVMSHRKAVAASIRELPRGAGRVSVVLLAVVWAAIATPASADPLRYAGETVLGLVLQVAAIGNFLLLVRALPAGVTDSVLSRPGIDGEESSGWRWALSAGAVAVLLTSLLNVLIYERVPHVADEVVYLLHARYFAEGMLVMPAPPVPGAFDVDLVYYDGDRAFVTTPPGWPAILAIGVKLGAPWLVNPLLSGVSVVLLHALVRRLDGELTARLSVLLMLLSPWFLFLGMSFMTHTSALAFALAAALGIAVAQRREAIWPALLSGAAIGVVSLIRPLEGLIVAIVLGVWSLRARHRVWRLLPSAALTASTIITGSLVRLYNVALTGDPGRFPIMMYVDRFYHTGANDLGFGANRGMGWGGLDPWPGHGLRDATLNTLLNASALQSELFGWATGSLLFIFLLVAANRLAAMDRTLVGIVVFVIVVHAFYWFSGGPDFGARYWFVALIPLVVITARAPRLLAGTDADSRRLAVGLTVLGILSTAAFTTWRGLEKYRGYRLMGDDFVRFADENDLGNALVLVRGRRHPDYHMAFMENPVRPDDRRPVFAWDRNRELRAAAISAFPERPVVIVDGPTVSGGAVRIVAGPLPPGSPLPDLPASEELPAAIGRQGATGREAPQQQPR
ncbi:MAG: hypothetical protein ACT4OZ_02405 [Gemmatimonadota bacterium]